MANAANSLIAAIPHFSGEAGEDVIAFLRNISDVANLENWPDARRNIIIRLCCRGKAQNFVCNDPFASRLETFQGLSNALIEKFKVRETFQEISHRFSSVTQKPKQTSKELAQEIKTIAHKYVENDTDNVQIEVLKSNLMLTKFLEALRSDIKSEVMKFGPQTFDEAVSKAADVEKALEIQSLTVNTIKSTQSMDVQILLEQQLESSKKIAELTETVNKLTNLNKITCHICQKNHKTTDCWQYPTNSNNFHNNQARGRGRVNNHYRPYYRNRRYTRNNLN